MGAVLILFVLFILILINGIANVVITFAIILVGIAIFPIILPIVNYIKKKGWLD